MVFHIALFFDRLAYFCCRFDHKARYEANFFDRYYSCKYICEVCAATRATSKGFDALMYCDFNRDAARRLTRISNDEYGSTCREISPWSHLEGWTVRSATHDLMHTLYLGIGRDLVPSLLADWVDLKLLGAGGPETQLATLSREMRLKFKQEQRLGNFGVVLMFPFPLLALNRLRISVRKMSFTVKNTRLNKKYPELSRGWKASHVKMVLWFMSKKAVELASTNSEPLTI